MNRRTTSPALVSSVATANAVSRLGARTVFADVEAGTGNVSGRTIEAALTPATRAVIVVDQGGLPVDLEPIRDLCDLAPDHGH